MPKVEISRSMLAAFMSKQLDMEALEKILPVAKAELDAIDTNRQLLKIELNDTNRPDLWSAAGIARQLRTYMNGKPTSYGFFSTRSVSVAPGNRRIEVHGSLKTIRPYIAAFSAEGEPIDHQLLQTLVQSQEKLCANYGRQRKTVAMGIYPGMGIEYPVYYRGADPDNTYFCPLNAESAMSLRKILETHAKGIEYGHIISEYKHYPYLEDSHGNCLSLPPIINSKQFGTVSAGDNHFFVELTGTDMDSVLTATAIIACDLADAGYRILPAKVIYPYDTPYGREVVTPYYFQKSCSVKKQDVCKVLGKQLSDQEIIDSLVKMGHQGEIEDETISITIPPYRNDFMHGVDITEEIMIGHGLDRFDPEFPEDATIGRLSGTEDVSRNVKDIMIGLGYQEMIYHYLGSKDDILDKMNIHEKDKNLVEIANPMSRNYGIIRNSIIPNLLNSEAVSAHALYPHKIFEIGCIVHKETGNGTAASTEHFIGMMLADTVAGFNEINTHISALLYYMNLKHRLKPVRDPRFIDGRCAAIVLNNQPFGILGEIHPEVLENWHVEMPCAVAEMDIAVFV